MSVTCDNPLVVFDRVRVDFLVPGNARVYWDISSHFHEPEPWSFQLQEGETDLEQGNWVDVGAPVVNTCFALDPTRRASFGKELNIFYRVKLTTASGNTYVSPASEVLSHLDFQAWNYAKEIARKEMIRLKGLRVGVEGYLLKIKRSGTPCDVCLDRFTGEVTNSNCTTCFGSRWIGGYYTPQPAIYGDVNAEDNYQVRETEENLGMSNPQIVQAMFVADPYLSTMDVFVNSVTDVRYHVHNIKIRTHVRGAAVLTVVDLRPIPFDNVVYSYLIPRPDRGCPLPEC
jgi:hypothetical protein